MATPDRDPSVFHEPHMQPAPPLRPRCSRCGYELPSPEAQCPECGRPAYEPASPEDAVEHSVWDEPTLQGANLGTPPPGAATYANWLAENQQRTSRLETWCYTAGLAVAAGPFAILGAFMGSGETTFGVLLAIVFAPVIEEVMKVAAATWAIERRPWWFGFRAQVLMCCLCGGLVFAAIENALYLNVYIPDPTPAIIWWRWTVCVAMHAGCSFIAGLGLARIWLTTVRQRTRPDLSLAYRYLLTAILIHATYNTFAVLFNDALFPAAPR